VLILLEGIDGSGKSTLAELLSQWLARSERSTQVLRNSSMHFDASAIEARASHLRQLLWPPSTEEQVNDVMGTHYYLFLHAAWATVVQNHRIAPLEAAGTSAILDGSHYRVIAKAHIRSRLDKPWLFTLFGEAPKPDLVILLDIDPRLAWHRRPQFKPSELGRWDGYETADAFDAYVGYQEQIRQELRDFAAQLDWLVVPQSGEPPAAILDRIVSHDRWQQFLRERPVER